LELRAIALVVLAMPVLGCTQRAATATNLEVRVLEFRSPTSFAARVFAEYPKVATRFHFTNVAVTTSSADAFARGDVDIAMTSADVAYFTYREPGRETSSANRLRAIAALQQVPMHLIVKSSAGIRTVRDIRSIGFLRATPVTDRVVERVVRELGIPKTVPLSGTQVRETLPLARPDLDALLISADYPSAFIQRFIKEGAELLDIDETAISHLEHEYPFIHAMTIPADTYERQNAPIHTMGINMLFVCRQGLPNDVVYELTRHLFDVLSELRHSYPELRRLELRQTLATPIPLHPGAAEYYREMELGS
jgi:TRAP transporter TAXI family solute receptor